MTQTATGLTVFCGRFVGLHRAAMWCGGHVASWHLPHVLQCIARCEGLERMREH